MDLSSSLHQRSVDLSDYAKCELNNVSQTFFNARSFCSIACSILSGRKKFLKHAGETPQSHGLQYSFTVIYNNPHSFIALCITAGIKCYVPTNCFRNHINILNFHFSIVRSRPLGLSCNIFTTSPENVGLDTTYVTSSPILLLLLLKCDREE